MNKCPPSACCEGWQLGRVCSVRECACVINVSLPSPINGINRMQTNKSRQVDAQPDLSPQGQTTFLIKHLYSTFETHSCACLKQGIGGREAPMRSTKPWNNRRFIGTFDVKNTTKGDSGRYRCIIHSEKAVGVSNYGELTIKRKHRGLGHSKRKTNTSQKTARFLILMTFYTHSRVNRT